MRLNELRDNPGAVVKRKRVGRGSGSGIGGTSGRGTKGQKSRSGVALKGFEGGQMPIHRRMPKRGFNNPGAKTFAVTNVGAIQAFIDAGKIDPSAKIDEAALVASGLVRRVRDGVRVLGRGEISAKIDLEVTGASGTAVRAVEAVGGALTTTGSKRAAKTEADPENEAKSGAEGEATDEAKTEAKSETQTEAESDATDAAKSGAKGETKTE